MNYSASFFLFLHQSLFLLLTFFPHHHLSGLFFLFVPYFFFNSEGTSRDVIDSRPILSSHSLSQLFLFFFCNSSFLFSNCLSFSSAFLFRTFITRAYFLVSLSQGLFIPLLLYLYIFIQWPQKNKLGTCISARYLNKRGGRIYIEAFLVCNQLVMQMQKKCGLIIYIHTRKYTCQYNFLRPRLILCMPLSSPKFTLEST